MIVLILKFTATSVKMKVYWDSLLNHVEITS
jgi:hypothetical protein